MYKQWYISDTLSNWFDDNVHYALTRSNLTFCVSGLAWSNRGKFHCVRSSICIEVSAGSIENFGTIFWRHRCQFMVSLQRELWYVYSVEIDKKITELGIIHDTTKKENIVSI